MEEKRIRVRLREMRGEEVSTDGSQLQFFFRSEIKGAPT
jgi:hypothetical protein